MRYVVAKSREHSTTWLAGAVEDDDGEGEMYMVIFEGPKARQRANEYATWKNTAVEARSAASRAAHSSR